MTREPTYLFTHMPAGIGSVMAACQRRPRDARVPQHLLPELHLVCGADSRSSGLHAMALLPTGGEYPSPVTLIDVRWKSPVLSLEELVLIVLRGLREYCVEAGYDLTGL